MKTLMLFLVLLSTLSFGQTLPQVVDNSQWFPPVRSQQVLPNCTQFSLIYYLKSSIWNKKFNRDPKLEVNQFNHNFVWNQTVDPTYKKSGTQAGFEFMKDQGCATMADFPANEQTSDIQPTLVVKEKALNFKSKRLFKVDFNDCNRQVDKVSAKLKSLKDSLAAGKCFTLNVLIFDSFFKMSINHNIYSCYGDVSLDSIRPSHVVTVVGYDDNIKTAKGQGAFKVMDSNTELTAGIFYFDYNWLYMTLSDYTCFFLEEDFYSQPKISLGINLSGGISGQDVAGYKNLFVDTVFNYSGKKVDFVDAINYFCKPNQLQVSNINGKKLKMRSKLITKPLNNLDGNFELISDLTDLSSATDFKSASIVVFDPISVNYVGSDNQSFYSYTRESKLSVEKAYLSFVGTDKKIVAKVKDLADTTIVVSNFYSVVAGLNLKPFNENIYVKSCTSTLKRKLITFSIADAETNTPPVFTQVPSGVQSVYVGSEFKFQFKANDPESSPIVYAVTSGLGANIDPTSGSFSYQPDKEGTFTFTVKATDGLYDIVNTFTVTVNPLPENKAPYFTATPSASITVEVNKPVNFKFIGIDPEGLPVTYSIMNGLGASINSLSGDFNYPASQIGNLAFIVAASDGSKFVTFQFFITVNPRANTSPYLIENPGWLGVEAGVILNYQIKAADKENDKISFSLKSPVVGATLSSEGLLSFKTDVAGTYYVTVLANDGFGGEISFRFDLIVSPKANTPPAFINPPGTLQAYTNTTLTYQFEVTDLDGDPITFFMQNPLAGVQLSSDGKLTFLSANVNTYRFTVVASDGKALTNLAVAVQVDFNVDAETIIEPQYAVSIYPNPVSANTSVELIMKKNGLVNLTIYDLQGRQVEVITNAEYEAGKNTISYDASNLRSGTYICRFIAPGFTKSIKIIKQ